MATLTISTNPRSTRNAIASRPRLTMPLARALETILVSGALEASSSRYAVSTLSAATGAVMGRNHKSTTTDAVVLLDSRKPCGAVDGRGAGMSRQDAFVISLGSRPPSPPVL